MKNSTSKRILAIHDLSGFGHTSLMAFIPIMYRLGIRVCALPTAILSANTDYQDSRWIDLSSELEGFTDHWAALDLKYSAICSGFLASAAQAKLIGRIMDKMRREDTLVLVDPVMGDNAKLYSCFRSDMVEAMRALVTRADIITPNFTEAALLAGADPTKAADPAQILNWCRSIASSGPRQIVLTSVPTNSSDRLEVWHYDSRADGFSVHPFEVKPGHHPGAGDCFTALLLAGLMNGYKLEASVSAAVGIMSRAILEELPPETDWREGIALEHLLQWDLPAYFRGER